MCVCVRACVHVCVRACVRACDIESGGRDHIEDAVGIRLSDKHLVYSLSSVFEMVSSPAFNVYMVVACCCPILHIS